MVDDVQPAAIRVHVTLERVVERTFHREQTPRT
jgi:hypothetical protein